MRLYLVITLLSSLLFVNSALADSSSPPDADVKMSNLVPFVSMGEIDDFKYTLPGFIWRSTQYMRFSLKKDEKQQLLGLSHSYLFKNFLIHDGKS